MQHPPSHRARALVALAAAAVLGAALPAARLITGGPPSWVTFPEYAERTFAPLRARLAPGERIGLVLDSGNPDADGAMHYAAQYALAPALVEPLYVEDCQRPGRGPRCRVDGARKVLVLSSNPATVAFFERLLGRQAAERFEGLTVLETAR